MSTSIMDIAGGPERAEGSIMSNRLSRETHHLLEIFPLEVWNLIAKKLDGNSLINLMNSSQFFRDLLLEKRVIFLFQPMLKILATNLIQNCDVSLDDYVFSMHGYPMVKPVKSLILSIRLGCRSWNKAIQELSSTTRFEESYILPFGKSEVISLLISKCYNLSSTNYSSAFLEKFTKSHASTKSNPFLSLSLIIMGPIGGGHYGNGGDPEIFFTQIPEIIKTFGHHLWTLYFQLCWNFTTEFERHSKTVELLNYLPNLQSLTIIFKHFVYTDNLNKNISFPNLSHLRKLECHNWPTKSFNLFVRQNTQIAQLTIFRYSDKYRYNLSPLISLKYLSIELFSHCDQQVLFENPEVKFPQIQKLRLHYLNTQDGSGEVQFVRWSNVFQMLSKKFRDNDHLEDLDIRLPKAENEEERKLILTDSLYQRLTLQKLKRLTITIYESEASIDFLLGLSETLEELKLMLDLDELGEEDSLNTASFLVKLDNKIDQPNTHIIKFVGFKCHMMESNIWDMLPALKKFELWVHPTYNKMYLREKDNK